MLRSTSKETDSGQ